MKRLKASATTQALNFELRCQGFSKKIQICVCLLTFSLKLEKGSFYVADLARTGKKCTAIIKAREGRAKVLFLFIKYAQLLSIPSRRRS